MNRIVFLSLISFIVSIQSATGQQPVQIEGQIKMARVAVWDQHNREIHLQLDSAKAANTAELFFPAVESRQRPKQDADGAIAFYNTDGQMTRVRFYVSKNGPLIFDIKRKFYQRQSKPDDPKRRFTVAEFRQQLTSGAQVAATGLEPASPLAPKFFDITTLEVRSVTGLGSHLGAFRAFDPEGEEIRYQVELIDHPRRPPDDTFSIDADEGSLYLKSISKDLKTKQPYRVVIVATNESGLSTRHPVDITFLVPFH